MNGPYSEVAVPLAPAQYDRYITDITDPRYGRNRARTQILKETRHAPCPCSRI